MLLENHHAPPLASEEQAEHKPRRPAAENADVGVPHAATLPPARQRRPFSIGEESPFAVDDIDAVVASLRARGAELVGERVHTTAGVVGEGRPHAPKRKVTR